MSQTWIIKDTAPVDEASITLATTFISFTTNNQKATSIGLSPNGSVIRVIYGGIGDIAGCGYGIGPTFVWTNEAYKTLEFDTAPTGELLAWLQKNADKQSEPEYLTLKSELTSVADAIRAKGGTSAQLVYPVGFVSAIQAIQTGSPLQIVVTTSAGATVTATKGSKTVSGTADASGKCTLTVNESGAWTVSSVLGDLTGNVTVLVGTSDVALSLADPVFENNSWATIIEMCHQGAIPDSWAVGNNKMMTINNTDYQVDIIGKNHDTYTAGGIAPLTFQLHDCFSATKAMNSDDTNVGGWASSGMRTGRLPALFALMPEYVQNGIRNVDKKTSIGNASSTIEVTSDNLFLLSEIEIFGKTTKSYAGEGVQYDYYKSGNSKVKKVGSAAAIWWERSPVTASKGGFCQVSKAGAAASQIASISNGVSFAFCF